MRWSSCRPSAPREFSPVHCTVPSVSRTHVSSPAAETRCGHAFGLSTCERVGYATSAEVSGNFDRVVGYAGVLLS